jgi:predicted DNA binding CopG/RHH family protein
MKPGRVDIPAITDEEELDLIASSERGEWVPVHNFEEQKAYLEHLARNTLAKKRKRISISVPERDLMKLKRRAEEEGMPYQTLINSILHKYVNKADS